MEVWRSHCTRKWPLELMGPFTTTERGKSGEKQNWRKIPNESAWRPPVGSCMSLELKPVLIGPFVPFSWRAVNWWSRSSTVHRAAWLGPEPDVLSVCLKGVVLSKQLLEIRLHICKGHGLTTFTSSSVAETLLPRSSFVGGFVGDSRISTSSLVTYVIPFS